MDKPAPMKVVVCGGRDYTNAPLLFHTLDQLHAEHRFTDIVQGGAAGADALARKWAMIHPEIKRHVCRADWRKFGLKAGPIRNARMIEWGPDLVIAFPGHSGTADMVKKARLFGIKVIEIVEVK